MKDPKVEYAARMAHETNRAYCQSIGDYSHLPWETTPEEMRDSARPGVVNIINHPKITAAQLHQTWMDQKKKDGWVYGPTKDLDKKTHPFMVPYADLPETDRTKDHIFNSVVRVALNDYDRIHPQSD